MPTLRTELDHTWRTWLLHNVNRRVAPARLIRDMVNNGFEETFATSVVHEMLHYPIMKPIWDGHDTIDCNGHIVRVVGRVERPEIMVLENLITDEECEELIEYSRSRLAQSNVIDSGSGSHVPHRDRISEGAFLKSAETDLLKKLDERASIIMQVPKSHGEDFQVVHYKPGGEYKAHFDYFPPGIQGSQSHIANGGNRQSTLIFYLNDVESGGSTSFPNINFSVSAKRGAGLFFKYSDSKGKLDDQSLHAGDPVFLGEKWIMTKWMRERQRS